MWGNLVNIHDFGRLAEKVFQGQGRKLFGKLLHPQQGRVIETWKHTDGAPRHWGNIPAIRTRWNRMVTGNEDRTPRAFIAETFLAGEAKQALSLGCGTGRNEMAWAETGVFGRIDAVDLSPPRIEAAAREARERGLDAILHFEVADIAKLAVPPGSYDVILTEGILHHLTPLRAHIERLHAMLGPGGLLILNDYVGPSRFQWTDRQLQAVNGLLALIPEERRRRWGSDLLKRRVHRPGRLSMYLHDPSEAVESSRILPELERRFEALALHPYGGSLLHPLFSDIAHHFIDGDSAGRELLALCFAAEDYFLDVERQPSDFVFGVYRRKQ